MEFIRRKQLERDFSEDKKYRATTKDGKDYLLRISPMYRYNDRATLFQMLKCAQVMGIPLAEPIEFGHCDEGAYTIQSWIEGDILEKAIIGLSKERQYALGLRAGEVLRMIHSFPPPENQSEWAPRFNEKLVVQIKKFLACQLEFEGSDAVFDYISQNQHLLEDRPQCLKHGEYHIGKMMLDRGELKIMDFDSYDFGDPWDEFNRIVYSAAVSPHFATGQIRGYFGGVPPEKFWRLMAFYIVCSTLTSVYWAVPFGNAEIELMQRQAEEVVRWFDGMKNPVPTWYLRNFAIK